MFAAFSFLGTKEMMPVQVRVTRSESRKAKPVLLFVTRNSRLEPRLFCAAGALPEVLFFHPRDDALEGFFYLVQGGGVTDAQGVLAGFAEGVAGDGADAGFAQ